MNRDTAAGVALDAMIAGGMRAVVIVAVEHDGALHEWRRGLEDNPPGPTDDVLPPAPIDMIDDGGDEGESADDGE